MNELFTIARHFVDPNTIEEIAPLGNGLINDTYKIMVSGQPKYVLQRINNAVFTDVEMLQGNIEAVTSHIRQKYEKQGVADLGRRVLHFLKADTGKTYVFEDGKYWRVMDFIADSYTYEAVSPEYAYYAGRSFGDFESLLTDLETPIGEIRRRKLEHRHDRHSADVLRLHCDERQEIREFRRVPDGFRPPVPGPVHPEGDFHRPAGQ